MRAAVNAGRVVCVSLLRLSFTLATQAQDIPVPQLKPGSERRPEPPAAVVPPAPQTIQLIVPRGTPIQVALDEEVRVHKIGQTMHARVVEPVYAFDKLVVPVGSEVFGRITQIEATPKGKRTEAALNADFTPLRKIQVEFTEIVTKDGKHIPVHTSVAQGSGEVLRFSSAGEGEKKKTIKDTASQKTSEAKQQAKQEWDNAMKQLKTPGRMHRLKRLAQSQLPVHPQYIPTGTVYLAALNDPLDFGTEVMTPEVASSIGGVLPDGAVVHARLVTPLSSGNAKKDDPVEAVLSRPLFDQDRLILPQGSRLRGTVLQAQPARRLKKNGQLRVTFRELVPPDGVPEKVEATLEAVEAAKSGNVKLDSEGGAEATNPKTRYLSTGLSLALAAASGGGDSGDRDGLSGGNAAGGTGARVAGGAGGFKLVGMALGLAVKSRALGRAMGVYGAGISVYSNFMVRGREVVFPKDMAMDIGIGQRAKGAPAAPQPEKFQGDSAGKSGS
jgi:type IV secretory pathway VirB10-like protein